MTRVLEVLYGADATTLSAALRRALANDGPAILPREAGSGRALRARPASLGNAATEVVLGSVAAEPVLENAATEPVLGDPQGDGGSTLPTDVPKAVALVVETSGSSGAPKRVALSTDALLASAAAVESALGGPGQWLLALPTHYVAGAQVLVRSIVAGSEPVVHPAGRFSAQTFADLADQLDSPLRFSSLVPAQLARLVTAAEADPGIRRAAARLDSILIGGQALPAALHERATALGLRVVRTYGSSETAGGCVYDGRPIGQTVARISDGEIELSGPSLAEGYLGDDELTARTFRFDDGVRWYRTADSGTIVDGLLRVTGRVDNVIISGGVKVSLDRVERVVQSIPGFEQAVVVAQPDEQWGQTSVVVTDAPETDAALERVRAAVIVAVGRAAAPAAIRRVERLPRLSSGKPDRVAIARSLQGPAD